ncbi:MAG: DUF6276 family protein [Halobacteriales archaeon]
MAPVCPNCNADAVAFVVPEALRPNTPTGTTYASICRVCLTVDPLDEAPANSESLASVSDAFPEDTEAAAGVAVLVGLLESLALHRAQIEATVEHLEGEGVDAMLALTRLADDPDLRPAVDVHRRVHQLGQLLG